MNQAPWADRLQRGIAALQAGDAAGALRLIESAHAEAPEEPVLRYWLGNACRASGQTGRAERLLAELVRDEPGDTEAAFGLAFLLREQGRLAEAERVLDQHAARTDDAKALLRVVAFLRECNALEAALAILDRVIERQPDAGLLLRRARMLQNLGRFEAALADCRAALDRDPGLGGAWLSLALLQRFDDEQHPDLERMRAAGPAELGEDGSMGLAFALGKALDDLDRPAEAFAQFRAGNSIRARQQPWDRAAWNDWLQQALAREPEPPLAGGDQRRPLFVIGMLRSGTTLLEEHLARHPRITARGEMNWLAHVARHHPDPRRLSAADRAQLGDDLWRQLRRDGPADHVYVDKNPLNFRFVDLALALLPGARFVHVERDPRDSALSCYFQLFQHPDTAFTNDLEDLADYVSGYRRLVDHWRTAYPDRVHDVHYEQMVSEPEAALRDVLAFLELDWDPAVLTAGEDARPVRTASAWQARQPVHRSSVGKWQRYADQAPEFFERLAPAPGG
ncbi:MAG: sulfotransferase [Xanthomonadales bacterium]|nr:sulfotransferase [Xanthomonadales bacterium]